MSRIANAVRRALTVEHTHSHMAPPAEGYSGIVHACGHDTHTHQRHLKQGKDCYGNRLTSHTCDRQEAV